MAELFSITAGLTFALVIVLYFRQVKKGVSVPNPATWVITASAMIVNMITYLAMVDGNVFDGCMTIFSAVGSTGILIYSLIKEKFSKPNLFDKCVLAAIVIITVYGIVTRDHNNTNLLIQICLVISFVPMIKGLITRENQESPVAWSVAVVAYILMIISIGFDWDGNWYRFGFPVINGLVGNGGIAVIALIQNRRNNASH